MKKYIPKNESDDLNPKYMFCGVATDLLVAIVHGAIDPVELGFNELQNSGFGKTRNR